MPLSDEERERLGELEYELSAADPQLARKLRSGLVQGRPETGTILHGVSVLAAVGLMIAGLLALVTGSGFGGLLLLGAGCYWLTRLRQPAAPQRNPDEE